MYKNHSAPAVYTSIIQNQMTSIGRHLDADHLDPKIRLLPASYSLDLIFHHIYNVTHQINLRVIIIWPLVICIYT